MMADGFDLSRVVLQLSLVVFEYGVLFLEARQLSPEIGNFCLHGLRIVVAL